MSVLSHFRDDYISRWWIKGGVGHITDNRLDNRNSSLHVYFSSLFTTYFKYLGFLGIRQSNSNKHLEKGLENATIGDMCEYSFKGACKNTLVQWNVIMHANVTLPLTLVSNKLNVLFSPRSFNGTKINCFQVYFWRYNAKIVSKLWKSHLTRLSLESSISRSRL